MPRPVYAEDTPTVDLRSVIANLEDRLPIIDEVELSNHPLPIGALQPLVRDALIYLKRYRDVLCKPPLSE